MGGDEQGRRVARGRDPPLAPDRLWVADCTSVSTWSGWCYTAFVIDAYARRILGWSVATTMTSQLVVDAVAQGIWTRRARGQGPHWPDRAPRPRQPVPVRGLHRAPRHGRDQALHRRRRLVLRQRSGRVDHRALQDRADQAPPALEGRRGPRDRDRRVGRLVQPPPRLRVLRRPHARRSGTGSPRSTADVSDR